jgi:hypothetical protein
MDGTVSALVWVACLGGAGGAVSAWLARPSGYESALGRLGGRQKRAVILVRLGHLALAAAIAAATAAAIAWMIGSLASTPPWAGAGTFPAALAFFWIGFVTSGWMAAERDKLLLRQAVCRAATAPAAHPDTVQAFAHASPDAIYEAVKALVPRRVVH